MFSFRPKNLTEDAQFILDIVNEYSKKDGVRKLISPISDEYFLIDDRNQIHICITNGKVIFSNHIFLYEKIFNLSFTEVLKKKVREGMEQEMKMLKKSLFKNETNLLNKILSLADGNAKPPVISLKSKVQGE